MEEPVQKKELPHRFFFFLQHKKKLLIITAKILKVISCCDQKKHLTLQVIEITFKVNSLKDVISDADPLIPTWHSYMRRDFATFGRVCLHL